MLPDRFILSSRLWVLTQPTGSAVYDFDFRSFFDCATPYSPPERLAGVARLGAVEDYLTFHQECRDQGIELVHTPEQHLRCSALPEWYPLIRDDTPRSRWYHGIPTLAELENDFAFPVFIKGARQTSRHQAAASIITDRADYATAVDLYRHDPILHWQDFVCRELIPLRPVAGGLTGKIPASYEFRTFWWRGQLVGAGRYWLEADDYRWTSHERDEALTVARRAVATLACTFLVVDLAQTREGRWIVIECNDGMESGYAGASPFAIWQTILEAEKENAAS